MRLYRLPPTVLPASEVPGSVTPDFLAAQLAALGYPGFAHLRGAVRQVNPAVFLLTALAERNLEARVWPKASPGLLRITRTWIVTGWYFANLGD
jgi:hypothetical protein